MARPLRIEFPGAVYHITTRGNAQENIFLDNTDRHMFLGVLNDTVEKYNWLCHAYCLMNNHFHLVVETPDPNLSLGMRQLNGVYTQAFNRRHTRVGHVFQGRFKSILVEKESHLLEVCRYVVLNPLRAGFVEKPGRWVWSSYLSTSSEKKKKPDFLVIDWILGQFSENRAEARRRYRKFVRDGINTKSPWEDVVGQIFFGGETFLAQMSDMLKKHEQVIEVPRVQRYANRPALKDIISRPVENKAERDKEISEAHITHGYILKEIADHLGLHYTTISKAIQGTKDKKNL